MVQGDAQTRPSHVALCVTCLGDAIYPAVGEATVRLLRRLDLPVDFPMGQTGCGQSEYGVQVHWATDATEARQIIAAIASQTKAKLTVKGKSMAAEEMQRNLYLEAQGIEVLETDLGEYIIQLAGETPSHSIAPAIHKTRQKIASLLHEKLGTPDTEHIPALTQIARRALREQFRSAWPWRVIFSAHRRTDNPVSLVDSCTRRQPA